MRRHSTRVIGLLACVATCRQHTTRVTLVLPPLRIPLGLLSALLLLVPPLLVPLLLVPLLLVPLLLVPGLLSLLMLVLGAPPASAAPAS